MSENNNVKHPSHYNNCSLECIDVMEITFGKISVYNFYICSAFKYIWRYRFKNGIEDVEKALNCINKAKEFTYYDYDENAKILKNHIYNLCVELEIIKGGDIIVNNKKV